jgi:hypothetical protein
MRRGRILFSIGLGVLILYAFLVRFLIIRWGFPYIYEWDEPQIATTALNMLRKGDFNPHFFNYPAFLIYSCLAVDILHYYYLMKLPSHHPYYLPHLGKLKLSYDTGWHWDISHPSFYIWNRIIIVMLAVGSILGIFFILKENFNKWIALLSMFLFVPLPWHIEYSARILPGMPMQFFAIISTLLSLRFLKDGKMKNLLSSAIFGGLCISSKYNGAPILLVPVVTYIIGIKKIKTNKSLVLLSIIILPIVTFCVFNPYIFKSWTHFLGASGGEIRHYALEGNAYPLWAIKKEIKLMNQNFTPQILIMSIIGGIILILKHWRKFIVGFMFPIVYGWIMINQKLIISRGFLPLYPFIVILSTIGIWYAGKWIFIWLAKVKKIKKEILFSLLVGIFFFNFSKKYFIKMKDSWIKWKWKDSRSLAINYINKISSPNEVVGIVNELHIHRLDLEKLKIKYFTFPHKKLPTYLDSCDYILLGKYSSVNEKFHQEDTLLNNLVPWDKVSHYIYGYPYTHRDAQNVNPRVFVLKK